MPRRLPLARRRRPASNNSLGRPYTDLSQLPVIVTIDEVAHFFRVNTRTVRRRIRAGTFRPKPFDRFPYRWRRDDIARELARVEAEA